MQGTTNDTKLYNDVQEYYGKIVKKTEDLLTNACTTSSMPFYVRNIVSSIHSEVVEKYYGCGLVVPEILEGMRVLDLGCGAGRDVYLISKLVGPNGFVCGVDMTQEQIDVANKYVDFHTKLFGYDTPNVSFKKGYIEKLDELGFENESFDIIISNCVLNLSPDKEAVLKQAFRVLKQGGEFYFSDVYADRRIPKNLKEHKELWGECLSGALYWNDFLCISKKCGFTDPRLVKDSPITISNVALEKLVNHIKFFSATYRLFKLERLESSCEDYGQAVIYQGTIPEFPHFIDLDANHHFETGKVVPVCFNSYLMLAKTRFNKHFKFINEDASTH